MTWTPPKRLYRQITAADLNTYGRDNIDYLAANLPHHVSMEHDLSVVEAGNAIARSSQPSQWYYQVFKQSASANADSFSQTFYCAAGTYTFSFLVRKTTASGMVDWELDGASIATGMDFYDAAGPTVNQILTIADVVISTPGEHTLTATVNGKNAGSSGYDVEITNYWATRTGAATTPYWERIYNTQTANLVGLWRLNEASGTTAADSSGNGYDGSYVGPTLAYYPGPDSENAPLFDGINDTVDLSAAASAFNGAAGTILIWGKVASSGVWTDGNTRVLLAAFVNSSNYIQLRKSNSNNIFAVQYQAGGTIKLVAKSSLTTTDWFCVAMTWDAGADEMKMYWDGAQEGSTQTGLGTWAGTPDIDIGSLSAASNFWSGGAAVCALWDVALSGAQLAALGVV